MKFRSFTRSFFLLLLFVPLFQSKVKAQSSLYLPAATSWVSVGDLDVTGDKLTVEALIYYTGASVNIVSKHTDPSNVNYLLRIGSFEITTTSGFAAFGGVAAAGVTIDPNRMYHVAATYDGSMLKYYVNGCLTGQMAWTGTMIQSNLLTAIGNQSLCQCEQYLGYIDEVRIWNVARTQTEISNNMSNLPSPATQPGLLGYWKFDGNYINVQGNTTFDGVPQGAPVLQQAPLPYPTTLHESITSSNPVCNGDAGGVINISASGYYTPYEYSIDGVNYGTSPVFSNLNAGTYTVYTRPQNNNGCAVSSAPVIISDPSMLSANVTANDVTCNGANNGNASVAPAGGDGPAYHQLWQPSMNTSASINNLSPGNYSVTVIDTCKAAGPELVTNGHFEAGNTGFTSGYTCCAGGPGNYAVDADPTFYNAGHAGSGYGGGGNFLIADGSVVAGTSFWCQTIPVTPNSYYSLSAMVASTYTSATAVIEFNINGVPVGVLNAPAVTSQWDPFQTVWFSGANTSANICISNQNTIGGGNDFGIDNISFKTCLSCTATETFSISEPPALVLTTSKTDVTCNGGTNGSATVTANGGTPGYSYSWNTTPVQTTATASNLPAGTYTVTVTDLNSCTATASVTILESSLLSVSISSQTNVLCNGGNTGSATAAANGGTLPYSFSWNSSPVQSGTSAANLIAGTYTVTVTDQNLCISTETVSITEPAALTVALSSQTNVSCNGGNNGSATVLPSGGTPVILCGWSTSPVQTGTTATNLSAGTYTVVVSDNNSCTASTSVTITEPPALSVSISSQSNVSCNGGTNGTADATATGGTGTYSYSWNSSPVQSTATANNLSASTYSVIVSDQNSCTATNTVTITEPSALTLSLDLKSDPLCFGSADGEIHLNSSGGTGTYTFNWLPNVSAVDSALNLSSGSYDITLTDQNNCTQSLNVVLNDPPALTLIVSASDNSICRGLSTTLTATAGGGTGTPAYSWNNGVSTATQTVQPITNTTYAVSVLDANNCSITDSVQITVFQPMMIDLGNDTSICQGDALTLDAGSGLTGYEWQNGSTLQTFTASVGGTYFVSAADPNGCLIKDTIALSIDPLPVIDLQDTLKICPGINNNLNANPGYAGYAWSTGEFTSSIQVNAAGNYVVAVIDVKGCINFDSTQVIEHPVPQLSFAAFPLSGCDPLDVSTINASPLNGSVIQSWQWQVGAEISNDTAPSFTLSPEGLYNVFIEATTDKGCIVDSLVTNYIEVFPTPDPVIVPLSLEYELTDDNIEILNQSTQATMYEWSVYNMLISTQQDLIYPVTDTGHFDFQLLAMNQYGCKDSTNVIITVNPSFAIYFPNAFTPNENGNNDIYLPSGYGIDEFDLMIFDRWGEMVFHSTDSTKGWDGTYKGNKPFKDVYVYKCRIRDIEGDQHYYFGHITLIQ